MATLTDAGRRALGIVREHPGINVADFAVEFWGKPGLTRIGQATNILDALSGEGYVSGSMRFKRHGRLWTLTLRGREALDGDA